MNREIPLRSAFFFTSKKTQASACGGMYTCMHSPYHSIICPCVFATLFCIYLVMLPSEPCFLCFIVTIVLPTIHSTFILAISRDHALQCVCECTHSSFGTSSNPIHVNPLSVRSVSFPSFPYLCLFVNTILPEFNQTAFCL